MEQWGPSQRQGQEKGKGSGKSQPRNSRTSQPMGSSAGQDMEFHAPNSYDPSGQMPLQDWSALETGPPIILISRSYTIEWTQ